MSSKASSNQGVEIIAEFEDRAIPLSAQGGQDWSRQPSHSANEGIRHLADFESVVQPLRGTTTSSKFVMHHEFQRIVEELEEKWQQLIAMRPVIANEISRSTPVGGVYLFSENMQHLYVGRTKRSIAVRIRNHFSTAPDCPFAWLLAREITNKKATYTRAGSRKALLSESAFKAEYDRAKERIRQMDVRFVHEPDPLKQTLLEIYVAVAANAKYNDFDTH